MFQEAKFREKNGDLQQRIRVIMIILVIFIYYVNSWVSYVD